jgi:adenylate cyclase
VDDQEPNVLLLEQMLRSVGYDCVSSTMDPGKVCELHLVNRYDLILLDLLMPGMDGFQVMENLREIGKDGYIPVIVITAQPDHKLRALKAGARDFLSKPVDLAEVLIRVHNHLETRVLQRETQRLYERVVAEQKVSERLLHMGGVPSPVGNDMDLPEAAPVGGPELIAESRAEVSLLFADLQGFTAFSEGAGAEALKGVLREMAHHANPCGPSPDLDRSKAIGEAYLAAMDLPDAEIDHTIQASNLALDLFEAVGRFNEHGHYKVKVKITLATHKPALGGNLEARRSFVF